MNSISELRQKEEFSKLPKNLVQQQKQQHEKQWTNPIEFLMTCIGFAVKI